MALIPAKCSQCGGKIEVDDKKESGVCKHCGMAYLNEEIVNNNITNNISQIKKQTNIYLSSNKFEEEKIQCKILVMSLEKFDFKGIRERALKILELNPENELATMIYNSDFSPFSWLNGDYIEVRFDLTAVEKYFKLRRGMIDEKFSLTFIELLLRKVDNSVKAHDLFRAILDNINALDFTTEKLRCFYDMIVTLFLIDKQRIEQFRNIASKSGSLALANILITRNAAISTIADMQSEKAKDLSILLTQTHCKFASIVVDYVYKTNFEEDVKSKIENDLNEAFPYDENGNPINQGCYIATSVYGSYDCPEVWVLRRYRDFKLAKSWLGRMFIKLYYKISPGVVKKCGDKKWFNKFWKRKLDKKVEKLKKSGYSSEKYDDPPYNY